MFQFIHVCDRGEPAKRIHSQSRRTPCTQEVYRGGGSSVFCHLPSPALNCYWLYRDLLANRSDCHIALRALKVSYSDVGEGGVAVKCEKNTIFPEHPV